MKTENPKPRTFDVTASCKAQSEYCKQINAPYFAPESGRCWKCGKNIYDPHENHGYIQGITVERAGSELITGCPHCNTTFCD